MKALFYKRKSLRLIALLSVIFLVKNVYAKFGEKVRYNFTPEPIDVVIPAIAKDLLTLDSSIAAIKQNCKNVGNIYVISPVKLTDNAVWIDEKLFPFSFMDIAQTIFKNDKAARDYLKKKDNRIGWVFQQLVKLYAYCVIPSISSNILLLDSDTIFLRPVTFLTDNNEPLYNTRSWVHKPYFDHAEQFIPGFKRVFPLRSGVSHHMIIQRPVLEALFKDVETIHNMPLWQAFCQFIKGIDKKNPAAASEFEIYFNYLFSTTDQAHCRLLKWSNISSLGYVNRFKKDGYHFVSCHSYLRNKKKNKH